MDYSNIDTLLHALDTEDCVTVKKCIEAGQRLDQIVFELPQYTILMNAIIQKKHKTIRTLFVFKKFWNLDATDMFNTSALGYAVSYRDIRTIHLLIQSGVDLNHQNEFGKFAFGYTPMKWEVRAMLLFAGADPKNTPTSPPLKKTVQIWLSGLEMAKLFLKDIFDNPTLENLICEFVFIEEYLNKVVPNDF